MSSRTLADASSRWLRSFHIAPAGAPRLICFPHAGGSASWYRPLSAALAETVDVVAVQYPGRQNRRGEAALEDVHGLAALVTDVLAADLDGRPVGLFGHSMGSLVAYEVARAMVMRGLPAPVHLFASGLPGPAIGRDERFRELDEAEMIAAVTAMGGMDPRLLAEPEVLKMTMSALQADYRAVRKYDVSAGPMLTCPVTALFGDADPVTSVEDAAAWADVTTGSFDLRVFVGGHFYLVEHAEAICRLIVDRLGGPEEQASCQFIAD